MNPPALELVVAHYGENLNWLRNVPPVFQKTVYSKTAAQPPIAQSTLPNVGREAHTYLHHLAVRYGSLAERTVFCQGKPFDHAYDFHTTLRELAERTPDRRPFRWLGHTIDTDTPDGALYRQWSKNMTGEGLDLAAFHRELFGSEGPEEYPFVLGAQFAVERKLVHRRERLFYERALALALSFPRAAHCFERTWDRVFGVRGIDPDWLAGRKTVYLKKMKKG